MRQLLAARRGGAIAGASGGARVAAAGGGAVGCMHLMELRLPMASAAYRTLSSVRLAGPDVADATGRPVEIDSCCAYAKERDLVSARSPALHRGGGRPGTPQR